MVADGTKRSAELGTGHTAQDSATGEPHTQEGVTSRGSAGAPPLPHPGPLFPPHESRRVRLRAAVIVCLLALSPTLSAGEGEEESVPAIAPSATHATRVETGPQLDGVIVGEAAWASAEPITGFRQTTPDEGQPATERTEVRIVFTDDTLYVRYVPFRRRVIPLSTIASAQPRRYSPLKDFLYGSATDYILMHTRLMVLVAH